MRAGMEKSVPVFYQYLPLFINCIFYYNGYMVIKIWEARMKKGITLMELSKRTGISKSALNNYENGKRYPDMLQMEKIAVALDTSISNLYESRCK